MDIEGAYRFLESNNAIIQELINNACKNDIESHSDFSSFINKKLTDNDHKIIRSFDNNESPETFITTVIVNLTKDYHEIEKAKNFLHSNDKIIQDLIINACKNDIESHSDFSSFIDKKLTYNDHKIIRSFDNNESPETFITTVIVNLTKDYHEIEKAKNFLHSKFKIIQEEIDKVCRRKNLYDEEANEFSSVVYEHLTDSDYKASRSLEGSGNFSQYLSSIISNLFTEKVIRSKKGKWQASTKAKAIGRKAIELEKLVLMMGFNIDQAIENIVANPVFSNCKDDAYKIASELKLVKKSTKRKKRRSAKNPKTGSMEVLENTSDTKSFSPENDLINGEIINKKDKIDKLVKKMLEKLTNEESLIIKMRFYDGGKDVSKIARAVNRKRIHVDNTIKRIMREFKAGLLSMGLSLDDINDIMNFGSDNQE